MDIPKETINHSKLPQHKVSDYVIKHVKKVYSVSFCYFCYFILCRNTKKSQPIRDNLKPRTARHLPMENNLNLKNANIEKEK